MIRNLVLPNSLRARHAMLSVVRLSARRMQSLSTLVGVTLPDSAEAWSAAGFTVGRSSSSAPVVRIANLRIKLEERRTALVFAPSLAAAGARDIDGLALADDDEMDDDDDDDRREHLSHPNGVARVFAACVRAPGASRSTRRALAEALGCDLAPAATRDDVFPGLRLMCVRDT